MRRHPWSIVGAAARRGVRHGASVGWAGFGATHALPMRLRERVIEALNMFNDHSVQFSDSDLAVGQAMADVATNRSAAPVQHPRETILSEQLQTALQSRILIEQGQGRARARTGLSVNEAFHKQRTHARATI